MIPPGWIEHKRIHRVENEEEAAIPHRPTHSPHGPYLPRCSLHDQPPVYAVANPTNNPLEHARCSDAVHHARHTQTLPLRERVSEARVEKYPESRKNSAMKKVWFVMLKAAMSAEERVGGKSGRGCMARSRGRRRVGRRGGGREEGEGVRRLSREWVRGIVGEHGQAVGGLDGLQEREGKTRGVTSTSWFLKIYAWNVKFWF
ncbi:hypothetical protein BU23DRAFT_260863 [Bimuria novae-zelandiae CBS 107.79]|uniref:Uncharacterized protein n=1 Tax=Bimuria novae-zelandiae CBS 107.79 TaxID=1447943 RepID=A0A6A5V066_9PLEO|nr:hypothetical protein BU23DRAFT_260863 [Bimuria novae-zelandiae CBS 107.79]